MVALLRSALASGPSTPLSLSRSLHETAVAAAHPSWREIVSEKDRDEFLEKIRLSPAEEKAAGIPKHLCGRYIVSETTQDARCKCILESLLPSVKDRHSTPLI